MSQSCTFFAIYNPSSAFFQFLPIAMHIRSRKCLGLIGFFLFFWSHLFRFCSFSGAVYEAISSARAQSNAREPNPGSGLSHSGHSLYLFHSLFLFRWGIVLGALLCSRCYFISSLVFFA